MGAAGMTGGCICGAIRYRLKREPMIVHCCHCTWCQRETGSAFVLNAVIEASEVDLLGGVPAYSTNPSASGRGQEIARCPTCHVAVWSHYSLGKAASFVRVGTLDNPNTCPPGVHIYTSSKQDWVVLDDAVPVCEAYYNPADVWHPDARQRWRVLKRLAS